MDIDDLTFRLLEHKLHSYEALYEEELAEIEGALNQLRREILILQRAREFEKATESASEARRRSDSRRRSQGLAL